MYTDVSKTFDKVTNCIKKWLNYFELYKKLTCFHLINFHQLILISYFLNSLKIKFIYIYIENKKKHKSVWKWKKITNKKIDEIERESVRKKNKGETK